MDRDELISICESAIVPMESWYNRDSGSAQVQLNVIYGLLKAGASYSTEIEGDTIWIKFSELDEATVSESFKYNLDIDTVEKFWEKYKGKDIEMFAGYDERDYLEYDKEPHFRMVTGYLPTWNRLNNNSGGDWY